MEWQPATRRTSASGSTGIAFGLCLLFVGADIVYLFHFICTHPLQVPPNSRFCQHTREHTLHAGLCHPGTTTPSMRRSASSSLAPWRVLQIKSIQCHCACDRKAGCFTWAFYNLKIQGSQLHQGKGKDLGTVQRIARSGWAAEVFGLRLPPPPAPVSGSKGRMSRPRARRRRAS